ncbi:MAG: hypothetical protein ACOVO3_00955 [Fluviicola sp.]|jgi:hypothetical protein
MKQIVIISCLSFFGTVYGQNEVKKPEPKLATEPVTKNPDKKPELKLHEPAPAEKTQKKQKGEPKLVLIERKP